MTLAVQLVVLAKSPRPGRVKTRLCPPYTPVQAAELAAAAIDDTLVAVLATPAARRVVALDEGPGDWLPAGFEVIGQRGRGLDERLAAAFADAWAGAALPTLLIGMDTPQVTPALLTAAAEALLARPGTAVLGPASDGGWWALGLPRPDDRLLLGVPMSTARTGALQRQRLVAAGLVPVELPELTDVDTAASARAVAAAAPCSAFATALAAADSALAA